MADQAEARELAIISCTCFKDTKRSSLGMSSRRVRSGLSWGLALATSLYERFPVGGLSTPGRACWPWPVELKVQGLQRLTWLQGPLTWQELQRPSWASRSGQQSEARLALEVVLGGNGDKSSLMDMYTIPGAHPVVSTSFGISRTGAPRRSLGSKRPRGSWTPGRKGGGGATSPEKLISMAVNQLRQNWAVG